MLRGLSWHVRMQLYRTWGSYRPLDEASLYRPETSPEGPVVAVTFARLKLRHTRRFARWGRPVEKQVREHGGKTCARVAFRPTRTFSTFSIWQSEKEMTSMVRGRREEDGPEHKGAMIERARKPFHFEFMTLRFLPLSHHGDWDAVRDDTTPAGLSPLG